MITEGTYPYAVGGVSSWCDALLGGLRDISWDVLPLVPGGKYMRPTYKLPDNARLLHPIELWSEDRVPRRLSRAGGTEDETAFPTQLLRGLMPWRGDLNELRLALVRCRVRPQSIRREFRAKESWQQFLRQLEPLLSDGDPEAAPAPIYDAIDAARLYQILYWVARTAAAPTPPCDLLHVTAAGWAAIPAIVHKALYGTPILLSEHGVYVREAYLASVRAPKAASQMHMSPRLALGLTRAAYAAADVVAPVTEANSEWERGLGVAADKIRVIPNGIAPSRQITPPPNAKRVVAIGRIDPLKDIQTMMLVAQEVCRRLPDARFEAWGPVTPGEEDYGDACRHMHAQLELGDRFCFMGRTTDPHGVIRGADVVLMTSISEGMPMALLEAMSQGRPVVATGVGGVPGVIRGCGLVTAPGDVHELASAVTLLLRNPGLAWMMGRRGYDRLHRRYTLNRCLETYDGLIRELSTRTAT